MGQNNTYPIDDLDFRNNIFYAANSEAVELVTAVDTVFNKFDNNIYYTGGATTFRMTNVNYADLSAYQAANPSFNSASLQGDPSFVSLTDLHLVGGLANDVGDNSLPILTDIDGDTRPFLGSTIVDIGADEYAPPSCLPVSNLMVSNIGNDSVTIAWNGSGNSYQYGIVLPGNAQTNGVTGITFLDSIRVGGLQTSTSYELYVREICTRGDTSMWVGPINFNTTCVLSTLPFNEGFSAQFPVCWTRSNATNVFTTTGCSGSTNESLQLFGVSGSFAETPPIDISSAGIVDIKYLYRKGFSSNCGETADAGDNINVEYWDGSTWNVVKNYDGSTAPTVFTPDSFTVNVSAFTGPLKVRFFYVSGSGANFDNYNFEDLSITTPATSEDLAFSALIEPMFNPDSCYGASENVVVRLSNLGGTVLDFTSTSASITVNVSGATTQQLSTVINTNAANGGSPLSIGSSIDVNVGTINMTAAGTYNFDGLLSMTLDTFPLNDTLRQSRVLLPVSGGFLSGTDTICGGDSTTLSANGYQGSLQWQELIGTTWTDILGANSMSIDVGPTSNTDYRVLACGSAPSDTLTVVPLVVTAPTLVKNNPTIVTCGSIGVDTLIMAGSPGTSLEWFDAPLGGSSVSSGDTLLYTVNTSSINTAVSDTFYVQSQTAGGGADTVKPSTHSTVYSGNARGYYFVAPSDFTITSLEVATQAGTGSQHIAVLKTNNNAAWNLWNAAITPFTTLYLGQNLSPTGYIPVNIPIKAGESIAIMGQRGTGNSYGTAAPILINGISTQIGRFIMQSQLGTTAPAAAAQLGAEGTLGTGNISRVNFTYGSGCVSSRTMIIGSVNCTVGIEDAEAISNLSITPNPSNGLFKLEINTVNQQNFNLAVRDVNGKLVYEDLIKVSGTLTKNIDFTKLAKGVYFMQIQSGENSRVEKLIIK